eukprot:TRINITY_DN21299_c0_g1_i1.p1 TRINITY_DN21299_c0_g1~~TRINITY_DN21299_c0_g1_i1.p1  ORF type:complete len:537 (-),score=104.48 TRINITY_DN21299_c0_g1_i1:332-1942(-)
MALQMLKQSGSALRQRLLAAPWRILETLLRAARERPRLALLLAWFAAEVRAYLAFRTRLAILRVPVLSDRRGSLEDLRWIRRSAESKVCPLSFGRASLQEYLRDKVGAAAAVITWEHYYATLAGGFCIVNPSPEEHSELIAATTAMVRREGLTPPPPGASPPVGVEAPVMFGKTDVQVLHKPFAIQSAFDAVRLSADMVFRILGYQRFWEATPEGWLCYWLRKPSASMSADRSNGSNGSMPPLVFIHGVGFGAVPYILFLEQLRRRWAGPIVAVELPNCSRCTFQTQMPTPAHFRHAFGRMLKAIGVSGPGGYMLVGHSLGTDFCSMVLNDPRGLASPILPARLVLLDPICFLHEVPAAHRLPFWTWEEARRKDDARTSPALAAVLFGIIRDEYTQQATKRAVCPGTDSVFRASPELLRACKTFVCLCGTDQALPAWKLHDYIRAHFPDLKLRIDPPLDHGGFLMPFISNGWISRSHLDDVVGFMKEHFASFARVSSEAAVDTTASKSKMLSVRSATTVCAPDNQLLAAVRAPRRH